MPSNADLVRGCIGYWKLDEASGTRVDSVGSYNLSENGGTIPGANFQPQIQADLCAGPVAVLNGTQVLQRTNSTDLHMGDVDFTTTAWFKLSSFPGGSGSLCIVGKNAPETSGRNWALQLGFGSTSFGIGFAFGTGTDSGGADVTQVILPRTFFLSNPLSSAIDLDRWYFVAGRKSSKAVEVVCYGGSPQYDNLRGQWGGKALVGFMASSVSRFAIGGYDSSVGTISSGMFGSIGPVGVWNRLLSYGEVGNVWNGGIGLDYPFRYPD